MSKKLTMMVILTIVSCISLTLAQDISKMKLEIKDIDGTEIGGPINTVTPGEVAGLQPMTVFGDNAVYTLNPTGIKTGYDLVSNGVPQTIWQDPMNPAKVHMVFMYSAETTGWADRTNLYVFSDDSGKTWTNFGTIPANATRTGFGAISGLSDGRSVIAGHTGDGGVTVHTQIYVEDSPGAGTFTRVDAGVVTGGDPIWPRILGMDNDKVIFASSVNGGTNFYTNLLTLPSTFSGYQEILDGDQAETYSFARSMDGSVVGMLNNGGADNPGDLFYRESNDNGVTWSVPFKVWDWDTINGTYGLDSMGILRGLQLSFIGNSPAAVFEIVLQDAVGGTYFPSGAAKIGFWNPDVNSGDVTYLAEVDPMDTVGNATTKILWNPNSGPNDVIVTLSRPTIGKSSDNKLLFASFHGTSNDFFIPGTGDTATYWDVFFTYSTDLGATWRKPEPFTDEFSSTRDFRLPSISPVNYCNPTTGYYTVQMNMLADSIPGSTVNSAAWSPTYPILVSAECVNVVATLSYINGVTDPFNPNSFDLSQNYPNPFNPSTKIKFSLTERSDVSLKVFDVLGREVANILNDTREAGTHVVNFNASKLASGLYVYTLKAGNKSISKKMVLLK